MLTTGSIRRDPNAPLRTRRLANGTLVVENAYAGTLFFGDVAIREVKGIRADPVGSPGSRPVRTDTKHPEG